MPASAKIIDLRKLLGERFPHPAVPTATHLITGLPFLDQPAGAGLPRGALTELISPRTSAGSASLIHALIGSANWDRSEEHTSELQSLRHLVCRLLLEK